MTPRIIEIITAIAIVKRVRVKVAGILLPIASKTFSPLKKDSPKSCLVKINQLLQANPGTDRVMIKLKNGHQTDKMIEIPYRIDFTSIKTSIEKIIKPIQGELVII